MTMIALATYGSDRVEFITDTVSYTQRLSTLGRCTKHIAMPHLDAAILTQGDSDYGDHAKFALWHLSRDSASFDELTDATQLMLSSLWEQCLEDGSVSADREATVFVVGYSNRAGKFVAYGHASEDEFEPFKIPGLFVMPTPWSMRPSKLELDRIRHDMRDAPDVDQVAKMWPTKPPTPAPRSAQEWVDLATTVRDQRSHARTAWAHVIVAGDVLHTTIKRGGSVTTRTIHTFDDTGAELLSLVEGTEHPIALAGPCYCGSGKTYGACHAGEFPCGCRSGKFFGDCCQARPDLGVARS